MLPNVFNTKLEESPYIDKLSTNLGMYIINFELLFRQKLNKSDIEYPDNIFEVILANKIQADIRAEISKYDGNIFVHESYELNKVQKNINKEFFTDENGIWHYK